MWFKRSIAFVGLLCASMAMFGQSLHFRADDITVPPTDLAGATNCVQIGIYMRLEGSTGVDFSSVATKVTYAINGGLTLAGSPVVEFSDWVGTANGSFPELGITNPGTPIASETCAGPDIRNNATQGGTSANYMPNNSVTGSNGNTGSLVEDVNTGTMTITCLRVDGSNPLFSSDATEYLVAIVSFPVTVASVSNGDSIDVTFATGPDDNSVTDSSSNTTDAAINGTLTDGRALFFQPVDCAGATVAPTNPTWADPQDGGIGSALTFTFPGTALADQVHLTSSDGLDVTIPSGGATTMYSIDTTNDGSPSAGANRTYTATYEVEFPAMSGTFIGGTACNIAPTFAPASATMVWDATPVIGMPTNLDATTTNAWFTAARYANLTGPGGLNVDATAPSAGGGTNVLSFDNLHSIASVSNADVGTYTLTGFGPDGTMFTQNLVLTLEPPVNQTICGDITSADIGGSVDITLAGNAGTVDFTVIYDGTTYDNLPAGLFNLPNIVGDVTSITIRANGFDVSGNPIFDEIVCDIDYNPPTCAATQDPTGSVDVGTVLTLFLDTTNAVTATITAVPMTPDVDPNTNFNVQWSATHTATSPTVITAIATNPDGETATCTWTIDVNCAASIVSVGTAGSNGTVTIEGIGGVTYDIYYADSCANGPGQTLPGDAVLAGQISLVGAGIVTGSGPAGHFIVADTCYYVTCDGSDIILDRYAFRTVPTLGEWGLIAFSILLVGAGLVLMRRRRLA